MMSSRRLKEDEIPLDPKEGVNPILTNCPICGQASGEIALVGESNVYECVSDSCDKRTVSYVGVRPPENCRCGARIDDGSKRRFDRYLHGHSVVSRVPCQQCADILKESSIAICKCRNMLKVTPYQATQEFDATPYMKEDGELDEERLIESGLVEAVIGSVFSIDECASCRET